MWTIIPRFRWRIWVFRWLLRVPTFGHRAVVLGQDRRELVAGLDALARGVPAPNLVEGTVATQTRVVFLFPGQGAQWAGMAARLYEDSPVFRRRLEEVAAAFDRILTGRCWMWFGDCRARRRWIVTRSCNRCCSR